VPGVRRVHMFPFLLNCVIQMSKRYDGEPQVAAYAAIGACPWIKTVIIVDEDVEPGDMNDVMWAVATRCKADAALQVLRNALGFVRDTTGIYHHKIVIDATVPLEHQGSLAFERVREAGWDTVKLEDYVTRDNPRQTQ
jgi:2,5-furandicarboxylate decarboxylase 1